MGRRKRVRAIFEYSNSCPQFIADAQAFKESLTTAPGNTYVTLTPVEITDFDTDLGALILAEAKAQSREDGTAAARDIAWDVVTKDVQDFVLKVQAAANAAPDVVLATAIVQGCGLVTQKTTAKTTPDIAVKNDKTVSGLLHLISKAAPKGTKASYEWQWSNNGTTFTPAVIAMRCRDTWTTTVAPGTKLYFRKRVKTNKDTGTPAWSQTVTIIVI